MSDLPEAALEALAPLQDRLREAAEAEAVEIRSRTAGQVQAMLDRARQDAARIREEATAEGEAQAQAEAAAQTARVRRRAHETVLALQEELRSELVRQVREAATGLRTHPEYPALLERLQMRARRELGPDAVITESPAGGIVARAGSRLLDLSLPLLATERLESRTSELRGLWSP